MKTNKSAALILWLGLLLPGGVVGQQAVQRPVFIRLDLPEAYPRYRSQWVYLFCMARNDLVLVDSCFLKNNVRSADFLFSTAALPKENRAFYDKNQTEEYRFWFTFAARGPVELYFYAMPGDSVRVEVPVTRYERLQARTSGSQINRAILRSLDAQKRASENLSRLLMIDSLHRTDEERDSILHYGRRVSYGIFLDETAATPSAQSALTLLGLIRHRAPEQITDSLILRIKSRFPESEEIRQYPEKMKSPSAAPSTKRTWARYKRILADWRAKQTDELYIGSAFPDAELPDTTGVRRSIARFSEKRFVLVDFWASWCKPCRREVKGLKRIAEKFADRLDVCAVSLDTDAGAWRNAIARDSSQRLHHRRMGLKNPVADSLLNYLPVDRIPTNFLLDARRRIIAMNLRGENLDEQIYEILVTH